MRVIKETKIDEVIKFTPLVEQKYSYYIYKLKGKLFLIPIIHIEGYRAKFYLFDNKILVKFGCKNAKFENVKELYYALNNLKLYYEYFINTKNNSTYNYDYLEESENYLIARGDNSEKALPKENWKYIKERKVPDIIDNKRSSGNILADVTTFSRKYTLYIKKNKFKTFKNKINVLFDILRYLNSELFHKEDISYNHIKIEKNIDNKSKYKITDENFKVETFKIWNRTSVRSIFKPWYQYFEI
jgi:hypothetical protein